MLSRAAVSMSTRTNLCQELSKCKGITQDTTCLVVKGAIDAILLCTEDVRLYCNQIVSKRVQILSHTKWDAMSNNKGTL